MKGWWASSLILCAAGVVSAGTTAQAVKSADWHWYRGNSHAHTQNSDGDASAEEVARWYRDHGYQFVVITDHESVTDVESLNRVVGEAGKFLVIPGEEVTQEVADATHPEGVREVHINSINPRRPVHALGTSCHDGLGRMAPAGSTVRQVLDRDISEIRGAGGLAQLNHPNFRWSLRVADLKSLPNDTLFEIWNGGHDPINNLGGFDASGRWAPSTEEMWDALLSDGKRIWAVASDDSHQYHELENLNSSRPGLAWIVVRARELSPAEIAAALSRGDFYASTGVILDDIVVTQHELKLTIRAPSSIPNAPDWKSDTRFVTRFIGVGGKALAEVGGLKPTYHIRVNDGYVRARITDSNGRQAWIQPTFAPNRLHIPATP